MTLKILNWNCAGALRKKILFVNDYDADILIIQECENPAKYTNWAGQYLWVGDKKGIGIFAKGNNTIKMGKVRISIIFAIYH